MAVTAGLVPHRTISLALAKSARAKLPVYPMTDSYTSTLGPTHSDQVPMLLGEPNQRARAS